MKLVILAPVAPFRGGIARHSTVLARTFAARSDCQLAIESFVRLYPRLLYPGEQQRDGTVDADVAVRCRYAIDTFNPFTWRRAAARVAAQPDTIAIVPAWTFFVAPALGWIARRLRRLGTIVIIIVHNAVDHERRGWKSRLLNWQLKAADGFVTHTDDLARQLRSAGHLQPITVSAHPPYSDFPPAKATLPRRSGLELLCFGLVRRYKGIDIALRALAASGLSDVRLTIAGEVWEDAAALRELIAQPELEGKVELINRYISDDEVAELFVRCDAVLAPYRAVTGSGVLAVAQHYRRPMIASNLPGFREAIQHGRTGWLFPPGDERALANLLLSDVTRERAAAMGHNLDKAPRNDAWHDYGQVILDLAARVAQSRGGGE